MSIGVQGLDSPTPFVQLAANIFRGNHESLLGTEIILQEPDGENMDMDPPKSYFMHTDIAGPSRILTPLTITSTRIQFREVELKKKEYPTIFGHSEFVGDDDEPLLTRPTTTLGGVVRDDQPSFFPSTTRSKRKEGNPLFRSLKNQRRWKKRPEGFITDGEGEEGEKSLNSQKQGETRARDSIVEDAGPSGEPREDDTDMQTAGEDDVKENGKDPGPTDETMKE
jgi:TFIIIC subunit triple barrel domain